MSTNDKKAGAVRKAPEGETPPVEGETPPVEGETPPVEGETPPVEGETEKEKRLKENRKKDKAATAARDRRAREKEEKEAAELAEKEAAAKRGNFIEEGKSVTSGRGILGPGERVTAKDFSGGEAVLKNLIDKKVVRVVK